MTTQVVALPATPDREALLVVGDHGRYIRIVALRDGVLQEIRRTDREGGHIVAVNVLPDAPGPQLAIIGRSELHLLDLDLRRVGGLTLNAERRPLTVESWQANPSTRLLLVADGLSPPFAFARAPRSFHPAWFAGGAAAVASLAGVAWRRQRLRRRAGQVETDPVILRELRLQLLGRLSKGGHEKIGALKSLRRLVWRLEAEAVSHADTGAAASEPARQRVDKAVSVVQADAAPRLRELLVLGHRTGVPGHLLAMARDLLDELATLLTAAGAGEAAYTDLHHQLAALAEELEAVLQRLRRHVEHHFRSDLAATVERVLAAQRDTLTAAAVSVTVTPHEAAPEPQVAIDVQDLEFVVDNLVGNAIRAMDGASRRELRLDWSVSGERVLLTVADSGCGHRPGRLGCHLRRRLEHPPRRRLRPGALAARAGHLRRFAAGGAERPGPGHHLPDDPARAARFAMTPVPLIAYRHADLAALPRADDARPDLPRTARLASRPGSWAGAPAVVTPFRLRACPWPRPRPRLPPPSAARWRADAPSPSCRTPTRARPRSPRSSCCTAARCSWRAR